MTHRGPFQPLPFCDSVIFFPDVLNSILSKQIETKPQPLNVRLYLHLTWHGTHHGDNGQEIVSSESQLHTQKRRQSFLLHCAAAKEKIKIAFHFV